MASVTAPIGLVAGSGISLTSLLETTTEERPFQDIPHLPPTAVKGHTGRYLRGQCGDAPIIVQQGRLHIYEGHSPDTVARTVDVLYDMGARTIIFTNAVGGLLPEMKPGDLVSPRRIRLWPYRPWKSHPEFIPIDFVIPGCDFSGTYMWMHGPCYETRAEIIALQRLHGAVVGMSTLPEIQRCKKLSIRAAILSCVTNSCCRPAKLTHDEVVKTAHKTTDRLVHTIRQALTQFLPHQPSST